MGFPINIIDRQTGAAQRVTNNGEAVSAVISPNQSQQWEMLVTDQPYVFAPPVSGKSMRLMNILMYANKSVGVGDASVSIYTSPDPESLTGTTVMDFELPKYAIRDLIGLNLALPEGIFLLAITNDATVFMTMMGYYADTSHDNR